MKDKLKKAWKFLNGKKRTIGLVMMGTGKVLDLFPPAIPVGEVLFYVGSILGGFGVIHDVKKNYMGNKK